MMFILYSLFVFRIINKYNNEFDQKYIHYRTSKVGTNEYLCYNPDNETHLHKVFKSPNIKYSKKKIAQLDGMDFRSSNISAIYNELFYQTQKVKDIYETSKTYKNNINKLDKIRKTGILNPPEYKNTIYATPNIWKGLEDW